MKKAKLFAVILSLATLTGCSSESGAPVSETETDSGESKTIYEINFPSYDEVQKQYPDKTVIVWAFPEFRYDVKAPFRTREVNAYLDELNCGFAICFEPIACEIGNEFPDTFLTAVKEKSASGGKIDIISPMNYEEFVFAGLYERLDDYLTSENGRGLYGAFPENFWESMRINGSIYGLSGSTSYTLSADWGYYVNAELAEKYGFDVSKPILEQYDILKKVKENETKCDVFSIGVPSVSDAVLSVDIKEIISGVYWNEESHSAECVLDNRDFVEKMRLYSELNNSGLLADSTISGNGNFFIYKKSVTASTLYSKTKTMEIEYWGNTVNFIPVFNESPSIRNCCVATGICSTSENKNTAFELLSLVYTDPDLNNLLSFGVEGEDYNIVDGMVDELVNPFNTYRFANDFICHRYRSATFTAEQYKEVYENALLHEDMDFVFDGSGLAEEVNSVTNIFLDYEFVPEYKEGDGKERDIDKRLAELRRQLEEAGIQKIIDECNRQYEVYKNEKG